MATNIPNLIVELTADEADALARVGRHFLASLAAEWLSEPGKRRYYALLTALPKLSPPSRKVRHDALPRPSTEKCDMSHLPTP
jgi:hypothetical protein